MALSSTLPAFESHGGRLEAFDDGHCPETFRFQQHEEKNGKNDGDPADNDGDIVTPRIVRYDSLQLTTPTSSTPTSPLSVHIYDDVLNPNNARMLYKVTASNRHVQQTMDKSVDVGQTDTSMKLEGESPWGTYVTIEEALEWIEWKKREGKPERNDNDNFEEYLVAWRQNMIRYYKWQTHERQSSDEKKEERIEPDDANDSYFHKQLDDMDNVRHALAVEAVANVFIETVPFQPGTTAVAKAQSGQSSNETLFHPAQILKQAHGVAVWALSSSPGHSVSYHMDYAELLRYEYNVTVPPLWAGTVQCSALWNDQRTAADNRHDEQLSRCVSPKQCMQGGEFCVNLRGLDHYGEHGYKGNLSGDSAGGWRRPDDATAGQYLKGGVHINDNDQWVTIPYSFNRGIVHCGDLPHLSAPIECIGTHEKSTADEEGDYPSRVIVGFNVFGHDVGARIAKAPEHSKPFRRKVRLYRSTINASTIVKKSVGGKSSQSGMDLSQIRKNKGLTKLLVLAKREKVKEELRRDQEQLTGRIWRRILSHHGQDMPLLRAADIVEEFGRPNDSLDRAWPKSIDVHVHLHHMLLSKNSVQDMAQQQRSRIHNLFQDNDGLAGSPGTLYRIKVAENGDESLSGGLIPLSTPLDIVEFN